MEHIFEKLRNLMVEQQLVKRNIRSPAVLNAMRSVRLHLFVPEEMQELSYEDRPLPIGEGQTISQPYIVAFMTEMLEPEPGMKVLEIGTDSGYQAAVLECIGCKVFSIELIKEHADRAVKIFSENNIDVRVRHGDGYSGWEEEAPFDAIIVTAAPQRIPDGLLSQLRDGGKMIVPVGAAHYVQSLKLITKIENAFTAEDLLDVRFVPMVKP